MKLSIVFILHVMYQPCLQAVFLTTDAERLSYSAELGGDVVMGCRFYPVSPHPHEDLMVSWHWISPAPYREVYHMNHGREQASFQHPDFRGRARLLTEEIKNGWAKLQVSRLRINDTGNYQCVVRTRDGADYKDIRLSVTAPYKTVTKNISKTARGSEHVLTCQSEGYPLSTVVWEDAHRQNLNASTAVMSTKDNLFKITTQIWVESSQKNNYTCRFEGSGSSATFLIPDEIQQQEKNTFSVHVRVVVICVVLGIALIFIVVLMYRHQKGLSRKKQKTSVEHIEEEKVIITPEGSMEHEQGDFLKGPHAQNSSDTKTRWERGTTSMQDLPRWLLSQYYS